MPKTLKLNTKAELWDVVEEGHEVENFPSKWGTYHRVVFNRDGVDYLVDYETVPQDGIQWDGPVEAYEAVSSQKTITVWHKKQ